MDLSREKIDLALPKVEAGLNKYLVIQNDYKNTLVSADREFQKRFNHFYRVRRGADWQERRRKQVGQSARFTPLFRQGRGD